VSYEQSAVAGHSAPVFAHAQPLPVSPVQLVGSPCDPHGSIAAHTPLGHVSPGAQAMPSASHSQAVSPAQLVASPCA
jgi:hypothetical protein